MKLFLLLIVALPQILTAGIKPSGDILYVYENAGSKSNNFCPSGFMGDFGDLKFNGRSGNIDNTNIQITYSAERKQAAGWSGIYWVTPCNQWGDKRSTGYDLSGFKKLTFKAKGEKGGEIIDKFFFGGISGAEAYDTDQNDTGEITLTKDWKEYSIDVSKNDLSKVIGGFGFTINSTLNPDGAVFLIDDIRYTR